MKLSGTLPKGEKNGIDHLNGKLAAHPERGYLALVYLDAKTITEDADTGEKTATARIRRIEALAPEDEAQAEEFLHRGLAARTGAELLPMEDLADADELLLANLASRSRPTLPAGVTIQFPNLKDD